MKKKMSTIAISWIYFMLLVAVNATLEVAKYRQTKQSTNEDPIYRQSSNAVDGNYHQSMTSSSDDCTHTADGLSWWAVDLGAIYDISNVVIFGRNDCCVGRLSNFTVEVFRPYRNKTSWFDESIITICYHQQEPITYVDANCSDRTIGQYVRIRLNDRNPLSLCEVEVHGTFFGDVHSITFPYIGGFQGHSYKGHEETLWSAKVNSDLRCTYMCVYMNDCHAADFNMKTSICTLMKRESGSDFVVNSDHNVFLVN